MRSHVEEFLQAQLAHYKRATASIRYAGLHRFFEWCLAEQETSASPMSKMLPPRIPETTPMVINDLQVRALLDACKAPGVNPTFRQRRDEAILRVLIYCGIRRFECVAITVADISLDEATLIVRNGKGATALWAIVRVDSWWEDARHALPPFGVTMTTPS